MKLSKEMKDACTATADTFEVFPELFCQRAYAKNIYNTAVHFDDPSAASFCAVAGVALALAHTDTSYASAKLKQARFGECLERLNNEDNGRVKIIAELRRLASE